MATKYEQITEGEWVRVRKRGHRNMCCHCALTHVIDYRTNSDGSLELRFRIDERATAAARRNFNFTKEPE